MNCPIAHFLLVLNNIPLSGCTTVYLPIQFPKDISVAFKFWKTSKAAINTACKVLRGHGFSTPLGIHKEHLLSSLNSKAGTQILVPQYLLLCIQNPSR